MQNHEAKSFKPLTISLENLPASTARQENLTSYAAQRAKLLLGCYRTGEANDPETYVAAITAILAHYPEQVITQVTHPASGLPSMKGWLPTVKEVSDACKVEGEFLARQEIEKRELAEQFAKRREEDAIQRPTVAELKEKYGENWGMKSLDKQAATSNYKAPTKEELSAHYREYGLQFRPKQTDAAE
jgi:hypothetical protein